MTIRPLMLSYRVRPATEQVTLHASHTVPGQIANLSNHLTVGGRKLGLLEAGYHYLITSDGRPYNCRPFTVQGVHHKHHDEVSIGVCLEGGLAENGDQEDNFTEAQLATFRSILGDLSHFYGKSLPVIPHRVGGRRCPPFTKENLELWTAPMKSYPPSKSSCFPTCGEAQA